MKGLIKQKLPHPKNFHSLRHDTKCDPVDYRTEMIWKRRNCHNFGDYHDIYFCMNSYGLEETHYMSSPRIAWKAMLKMTNFEMELFQCPLMHDFIEMRIRGEINTISCCLAKSNIPGTKTKA